MRGQIRKQGQRRWWGDLAAGLSFLLIMGLVYGKTVTFGLTYLDDNTLITEQASFLSSRGAWLQAFQRDVFEDGSAKRFYRPLMTWSLLFDQKIGGGAYQVFHVSNLFLAALASYSFYITLVKLHLSRMISWGASVMLLVHPLLTQAVVWIPGRNDLILSIFWLWAFISFINYIRNQSRWWLVGHWLFFAFAMFSKETAVGLPLLCGVYGLAYYPKERVRWWQKRIFLGWVGIIAVWAWLRTWAFSGADFGGSVSLIGWVNNLPSILVYLSKVVWPSCLSGVPMFRDSLWWPGLLLGLMVFVLSVKARMWREPLFVLGITWIGITLLPTLIPVELRAQHHIILEHRFYLPFMGLLSVISALYTKWERHLPRQAIGGLLLLLVLVWGILAYRHADNFRDAQSFWERAVSCSPHSAIAQANRGTLAYQFGQDTETAKKHLQKAVELYPQQAYVHGTLAAIAFDEGNYVAAASAAAEELTRTRSDETLFLMGAIQERLGNLAAAVPYWLEAVELNPDRDEAHLGLLQYYYVVDDREAAQAEARWLSDRILERLAPEVRRWLTEAERHR